MRPLLEKIKHSAIPHVLVACLSVASLMPDNAQAADYCRNTAKSIGKEIAIKDAARGDRTLAGIVGATVGAVTGAMVCGPDEQEVRAQQREIQRMQRERERMERAQQRAYERAYQEAVREQAREASRTRMSGRDEQRMMHDRIVNRAVGANPLAQIVSQMEDDMYAAASPSAQRMRNR